jgi:hypothetical protein
MSLPALARLETKSCMLVIDVGKRLSLAGPAGEQLMARRKLASQLLLCIDRRMLFILLCNLAHRSWMRKIRAVRHEFNFTL